MSLKYFNFLLITLTGYFPSVVLASCIGLNCTCTASSNAMSFLNYKALSATPNDTQGNVRVVCSALVAGLDVSYTITLSAGNSASYAPRKMTRLTNNLNYNLYRDGGYSQVWGDGSGSTFVVTDSYFLSLFSVTRNYTVYGRIPINQTVPAGTYNDSITATVIY